ncbi:hypothetical protein ACRQ5Q_37580 [Bradyrhizobium sp. PMVTL-01]|uniref:hypothetical protein n=1 Tax=Bradyrhizobium sp. PMVTL-01 TaxID=3434999 RepID=UPI003F72A2AD
MPQASKLPWLIKCAGVAAALLLACGLATPRFGATLQQPAVTTRDGRFIALNRYVHEPAPDIVLVGSSLTWRLREEYFSLPRIRNLALAGGSPLTGLEIVARQPNLPKIVLIETNFLTREADGALVESFSGGAPADVPLLRPVRTAIAAYEKWKHGPPNPAQARAEQERLLSQPPDNFDNKAYLDRALEQMNGIDPTLSARANVAIIRRLTDELQRRGARVFLIEVPFAAEIENARPVTISKAIVHDAFPDPELWLPINPPRSELRWADGVHLDQRSGLIVVRAIEVALAERDGMRQP